MTKVFYEANVLNANTYGYKTDDYRASIVKTEYDKNGKLIKKSFVEQIRVEKLELTEDEMKMLYYAFKNEEQIVSVLDEII